MTTHAIVTIACRWWAELLSVTAMSDTRIAGLRLAAIETLATAARRGRARD